MSKEIVRAVSKKLDHYLRVQRLEDSFDLSSAGQPIVNHPKLRELTLINTLSLHDKPLKHEFSSSQVRVKLRHMYPPKEDADGTSRRRRTKQEKSYTRQLETYMMPVALPAHPRPRSAAPSRSPVKDFAGVGNSGGAVLRMAPPVPCSRRERRQLLRRSGKILSYLAFSRRDDEEGGGGMEHHSRCRERAHEAPPPLDAMIEDRVRREFRRARSAERLPPPRQDEAAPREPAPAPSRSRAEPLVVYPMPNYSVTACQGTQTSSDYDQSAGPAPGPRCHSYTLYVTTGDKIGAGTSAPVSVVLYGDLGSSGLRPVSLSDSLTHKRPFRRGRTDKFVLSCLPELGGLRRLRVGHASDAYNHWHLHSVTVVCPSGNCWFFPCRAWLSEKSPDGLSTRTLAVELVGSVGGGDDVGGHREAETASPADLLPPRAADRAQAEGGGGEQNDDTDDVGGQVSFGLIDPASSTGDSSPTSGIRRRGRGRRQNCSATAATKSSASSSLSKATPITTTASTFTGTSKSSATSSSDSSASTMRPHTSSDGWRGRVGVNGGGGIGAADDAADADTMVDTESSTGRVSPEARHLLLDAGR